MATPSLSSSARQSGLPWLRFQRPLIEPDVWISQPDREALEAHLGITFPTSFLDVPRMRNGGCVRFGAVLGTVDGGKHDLYRFRSIAGIGDDHTLNVGRHAKSGRDWDIPEWLVPFEGDGHWWLGFDYRIADSADPPIVHIDSARPMRSFGSSTAARACPRTRTSGAGADFAAPSNLANLPR